MNYFIVTEGRAGSSLLCQHLTQMQIGKPYPYLSKDILLKKVSAEESIQDFLESKRVNGILGLKISWGIITAIDTHFKMEMNLHNFLNVICPDAKYIYQTRRDRVHQALSRIKHLAMDTSHVRSNNEYEKYKAKEQERLNGVDVPIKDIHDRIQRNACGYKAWEIYFKAYNIQPLEVAFEDLVSNRDTILEQICKFLGVPCQLDKLEDKLISTHSDVNDQWYDTLLQGYMKYV